MPPAARITDNHTCPMAAPTAHVGGPVVSGEATVFIGFMPAARVGDSVTCVPAVDVVAQGEATVIIGNQEAARLGDPTVHGGVIVQGCPTVFIGSDRQCDCLKGASEGGAPFVEKASTEGCC